MLLCTCISYFAVIFLCRGLRSWSVPASGILRSIGVTWLVKFVSGVGKQNRLSVLGTLIWEGVTEERGWRLVWTSPLYTYIHFFFYVLLTVHLSIFILVINQLDAQNLFYNKFISCLCMFRAPCAHRQGVKIVLYSLWCQHTYRCNDTKCCIIQFWPPDDEHMVLEICRGMK